ncbi:hypothetical protein QKT49_gp095 [Acanthamoeba castellanii medusavirus]|uniref:Ankyrin repeat protein n=1 Tax=Acanthamoeba castellanii medusavirus J1 TaxID=3114988 RepID=A0A3T1CWQ5_9VIRU|nr:hypothetical protein QKT49_gp095 [Acanthamoeba castellanii medusavirus]BBI30235.1 hypothetical protein [Acanthamoeba castellanii medusavirus J1]
MKRHIKEAVNQIAAQNGLPAAATDIIRDRALADADIKATGPDHNGVYSISAEVGHLLDRCYDAQMNKHHVERERQIDDFFTDAATRIATGGNFYHRLATAKNPHDRTNAFFWVRENYFLGGLRDKDAKGRTPFELALECGNFAIAAVLMHADQRFCEGKRPDAIFAHYHAFLEDIAYYDDDEEDSGTEEEEEEEHRCTAKKRRLDD